jgi:hypothetical protein
VRDSDNIDRQLYANACDVLLARIQTLHQRHSALLLRFEDTRSGVFASLGKNWLGTHEHRRQDELVAKHEAAQVHVMAVQLPGKVFWHWFLALIGAVQDGSLWDGAGPS